MYVYNAYDRIVTGEDALYANPMKNYITIEVMKF